MFVTINTKDCFFYEKPQVFCILFFRKEELLKFKRKIKNKCKIKLKIKGEIWFELNENTSVTSSGL